jgi:metal-responsive CopG/Arc/MetJ family transcriptional regulator
VKRILLTITDKQAKELEKYPNRSEAIRNAIDIYIEHISTDTIQGLRKSYTLLSNKLDSKFEYYDYVFKQLEKLIGMLETRM